MRLYSHPKTVDNPFVFIGVLYWNHKDYKFSSGLEITKRSIWQLSSWRGNKSLWRHRLGEAFVAIAGSLGIGQVTCIGDLLNFDHIAIFFHTEFDKNWARPKSIWTIPNLLCGCSCCDLFYSLSIIPCYWIRLINYLDLTCNLVM